MGMLVLTRRIGEQIVINDNIVVMVTAVEGDKVKLGIVAPKEVPVDRQEIFEAKRGFRTPAVENPQDAAESRVS